MKIFSNIGPLFKLIYALKYLRAYKKQILNARAAGDLELERDGQLKATSSWGSAIMNTFKVDLHIQGKENLPAKGPVVYAVNHEGYFDIPACCAAFNTVQIGFVAKDNLERIPLYGEWIKNIRSVLLKRDDPRAALKAIQYGIELIEQDFSLVVFPEGTRSKGGEIKEFKKGSLRLATKPGVPVIPVTLKGTSDIFEKTGKVECGKRVDIVIHPAIETKDMEKGEANNLSTVVEAIIRTAHEKL